MRAPRLRKIWPILAAELSAMLIAAGLLAIWANRSLPPQDLPWRPLAVDQPIGTFTRFKLRGGDTCRAVLGRAGFAPRAQPDRGFGPCRQHDTIRSEGSLLAPAAPLMTCRASLAYAIWERQVVAPAARDILGSPVLRIDHLGTYNCRVQRGSGLAVMSEHASANAIDVAAFELADGRRISVEHGWRAAGADGRFLHAVRDGACRLFEVTLSPDYNAEHYNHLHLDMGPFRTCG
jgi:hypothetical protein